MEREKNTNSEEDRLIRMKLRFSRSVEREKNTNSEEDRLIRVEKHSISPHYFLTVDSPKIFLKLSIAI